MSVSPTDDALIVALDFEGELGATCRQPSGTYFWRTTGVHSLERSAQEDTLLVLFNTAISNLVSKSHLAITAAHLNFRHMQVLFRNNFALSRDITGLFQSFQSSSSVLDPASNPSLFQSTLVVIIKVCSPYLVWYSCSGLPPRFLRM